jgi:DNA-binding MltR family transcriptional regulator
MAKKIKEEIRSLSDARFLKELESASPRATVIVGAAAIDRMLEQLLESKLVKNKAIAQEFFTGPSAPFGSFSSRIKAVYLLGLVSIKTYQDLESLRKIRNKFAHDIFDCDFNNKDVVNLIRGFNYGPKMFIPTNGSLMDPGHLFVLELLVISFSLTRQITRASRIKELDAESDDWGLEEMDFDWIRKRKADPE